MTSSATNRGASDLAVAGESTFVFADIAGFTALTEAHGDERAADLVAAFTADVQARLTVEGGELVKSIGDALMLRLDSSDAALELGRDLASRMAELHGYPSVRVGMHRGPAVRRGDDWFGATVNVAARVAAIAGAGEVLLTDAVRSSLADPQREDLKDRGPVHLRNVSEPVHIFACLPADPPGPRTVDPVCQMSVDPISSAGTLRYAGRTFHFCSLKCAQLFAAHPERYIGEIPPSSVASQAPGVS